MKIIKLNAATHTQFVEMGVLDKQIFERFGATYADEAWEMQHFRLLLPQKMDWSRLAIDENTQSVIGFCIASEKQGAVYIHRFVAPKQGDTSVGDVLLKDILNEFDIKPFITLVSTLNKNGVAFCEKHGLKIFAYEPGIEALMGSDNSHISRGEQIGAKWQYMMFRRVDDFRYIARTMASNLN